MTWNFPEEQPGAKEKVLVAAPAPQRTLTAAPAPRMSRQEIDEILERRRQRLEREAQDKARSKAAYEAQVKQRAARIAPEADLLKAIHTKYYRAENGYGVYLRYRDRLMNSSQRAAALNELSGDPDLKPFVDRVRQ